jgi:hypothetical protein
MIEILRTNDLVLISKIEAIFAARGIKHLVADQYMSAMEGSTGFLPRRILVEEAWYERAALALRSEGLDELLAP